MSIDIVDELEAEASYHYSSLFGRAVDEIKTLRKALRDISAVTFCPKCHGKKTLILDPRAQATAVMVLIGPLLDEWEGLPNDTKSAWREEAPELCAYLNKINAAVENG